MSYIVTGGCGFIGSNFVNYLCNVTDERVHVLDKMTYAANSGNILLKNYKNNRVTVNQCDLANNTWSVDDVLKRGDVKAIFHFAAESHVDNSISGPQIFIDANVTGTFNILQKAKEYDVPRFVHISTDEVYGTLGIDDPSFEETKILEPNNVYSASKASADLIVRSFNKTYGLDTVTTRCCNNYGPRQHKEKLVPKVIHNALNVIPIPVYGSGDNIREWIYVEDHCKAIYEVYKNGTSGDVYNIGSGKEIENIEMVKLILDIVGQPHDLIEFVTDRLGHDFRYSINSDKLNSIAKINYRDFTEGLERTVQWYKDYSNRPSCTIK